MPIDIEADEFTTALKKLQAREEAFLRLEEISKLGSWEVDLVTQQSIWSDQSYKIYGLDKDATQPNLELFFSMIYPEDLQNAQQTLQHAMMSGEVTTFQCRIKRLDGATRHLLLNGQVIHDAQKKPLKLIGTSQDITEYISLKQHTNEISDILECSSNEIYIINKETFKYLYVNKGACEALGYTKEELLTQDVFAINPNLTMEKVLQLQALYDATGKGIINKTIHKREDGSTYHVQSYIHPIVYNNQDAYVLFDVDITQIHEAQQTIQEQNLKLHYQTNYDKLTNLPNRTRFKDILAQTIETAQLRNEQFAVLFIDLDQFKKINDSFGHNLGDEILVELSKKINDSIRIENTLARLGGDEFAIIIKDIKNMQVPSKVARKILNIIKENLEIQGNKFYISASIGISLFPQDADNAEDIVKFADAAMYKAKDEGRDNFQFYSSDMTTLAFERVLLQSNLRIAIQEEQFIVHYQPQYDTNTNTIVGMEALVRWQHPELGLIPPNNFIPLAEESGLIIEIDRIVMKKAMKQFQEWYALGLQPGILSLNLAMKQLASHSFINELITVMQEHQFNPYWLELELTESQVMNNPDSAIKKLKEINELGIDIAIDDFGTGYSSLAYLKKLPLDKLKIDQSFIRDLDVDEDDKAIAKAIIGLGESLNLKIIAEGVETKEQLEFLQQNRCHYIQGYFYSRPIPAEQMTQLLKNN
jgi:diguanylate cyclase (GGDEF)-like protein/PAS domain S-box-containing protein